MSNEKQSTWLVRNGCSVGVKNAYAPRASTSDKTVEESVRPEIEQEYSLLPGLPKITIMTFAKSPRNTFRGMICALQPVV